MTKRDIDVGDRFIRTDGQGIIEVKEICVRGQETRITFRDFTAAEDYKESLDALDSRLTSNNLVPLCRGDHE